MPHVDANGIDDLLRAPRRGAAAAVRATAAARPSRPTGMMLSPTPSASRCSPSTSGASGAPPSRPAPTRWPTTRPTPPRCSTPWAGTRAGSPARASAAWSRRSSRSPSRSGSSASRSCARHRVATSRRTRCTRSPNCPPRRPPRSARGCSTPGSRPSGSPTHDDDRAVAEMVGTMRGAAKPDDVRRGELAQLDARSRLDVLDRLHRITCPTLVAAGRYDGIAPPRNGEEIAARIPGRRAAPLRGRPPLHDAGPAGHARHPRVPRGSPEVSR